MPWSWQLFGFNTGAMRFLLFRGLQRVKWLWSTRIEKRGIEDCVMIDDWCPSDEVCSFRVAAPILCSWCRCQEFAAWNSSSCTLLDACVAWSQIPDGRTGELFWAKDLHFWVVGKESLVSWCVLYSPHVVAMRQHAHDHRNGNLAAPVQKRNV